jgi:hypothetical protein
MKDLGKLHHFLGLLLHHRQYALDILEQAGMIDCKPCSTLVDTQEKLSADMGALLLLSGVLLVFCSTSLSPSRTWRMLFNRSVFICMIPGSYILLR